MKTIKFKCTLLTDVILNVKSASEGVNSTLDFIPGSCFLGIVASELYKKADAQAMEIFHSGRVRFGDAHPSINGRRALRIPASFYYAKGDSISDACYVHHYIENRKEIQAKSGAVAQLKQCRLGFYVMDDNQGEEVITNKQVAIKSAYDRDQRRSKEAALFVYESLSKGLELLFSVEIEQDVLAQKIKDSLVGKRHIGRSRTAQYGLVEIKEFDYDEVATYPDTTVAVYADSRLIFFDENGNISFQPTVQQLLGDNAEGEINWKASQVRTFQYAPWNYKRQCYDTDRCGIEKGSVFVIDKCKNINITSRYIGSYNNEGFGKVIYNPCFLQAQTNKNGLARCQFNHKDQHQQAANDSNDRQAKTILAISRTDSPLLSYLKRQSNAEIEKTNVYQKVNDFNARLFKGAKWASQWGTIRSIALREKDNDEIKKAIIEYISHGIKQEDWEGERKKKMVEFMDNNIDTLWESIINLASEMAKKCK